MQRLIAEVHGHLIEACMSAGLFEVVLLDGRPVSRRIMWLQSGGHHFDLTDDEGRTKHVEVRWVDRSRGLGVAYRVTILVDGRIRGTCQSAPLIVDPERPICMNCGYELAGLPIDNGEIRCPECGRHSSAAALGAPAPHP